MAIRRVGDLEIDQDLPFERRSWRFERVGTWAMVALIVLALLGLLGSGPLSRVQVRSEAGLGVDLQRVALYQTPGDMTVHLQPVATEVRVWIDRAYLDYSRVESIMPAPLRIEGAADRVIFVFAVAEPGRPMTVAMRLQPERIGPVRGRVGLEPAETGATVTFRQLVLP